ncbi:hypothetical protein AB0B45_22030 [Nonomuraea sp. NPDC049152]|uniref:hypothetical protein n=1 Tax=Nonomuraea sp. NPDC049152 TaxID=3154350 RepID=UPI0033D42B06
MFSLDERDRRWTLMRDLMDTEHVEAVLAYDGSYLTDAADTTAIVPRHGAPACLGARSPWMEPRAARHAYGIAEAVRVLGLDYSRVGVVGLDDVPYPVWASVLRQLPQVTFRSVWPGFLRRTMPQSCEELAVIMEGAAMSASMAEASGGEVSLRYGFRETVHRPGPVERPVLRPGTLFGEVKLSEGQSLHGLNPRGAVHTAGGEIVGYDLELVEGMTFALRTPDGIRTLIIGHLPDTD